MMLNLRPLGKMKHVEHPAQSTFAVSEVAATGLEYAISHVGFFI